MTAWLAANWFDLLQTLGILAGLIFTGLALRSDTRSRRVATLLQVTQYHREIWGRWLDDPALSRVFDRTLNDPGDITERERMFVRFLILHLFTVFEASKVGSYVTIEKQQETVRDLFSRPIFMTVWRELRRFHNADFVEFVDRALLVRSSSKSAQHSLKDGKGPET